MLSGYIYLRLKPYLVVKISFYIVTEHCCQVCVLSMMFCCSDCRLCADMVSDWAVRKLLAVLCGLTLPQANVGYEKIFFTFDFHILPYQRYIDARIIPCRCISMNCWIALKRYILLQTRSHIVTISQHNSVLHTFSVRDWSEMFGVINVLTVLL